jgi:hypothetical protein
MNKPFAILSALTLLTCRDQELATNVANVQNAEPVCEWSAGRFLPEGENLRQACSPTQNQQIEEAHAFIEKYHIEVAAALIARCMEAASFSCPLESYELLSRQGSLATYYCAQEPLRLEATDGTVLNEYAGVALDFRTNWTSGAYSLDESAFGNFCETVGTVAHEEAHIVSGIRHRYEGCELNRNDWVTAVGQEARLLCRKTLQGLSEEEAVVLSAD